MSDFITMINRIATELRRSTITDEIKNAINDAITEASKTRFYFNEMRTAFNTVPGTEYYADLGFVELDAVWYWRNDIIGGERVDLYVVNQLDANDMRVGNANTGMPESISRYGAQLRLEPVPSTAFFLRLDGYGKLDPSPLVNDADTNAWLTDGELYIRALAKRNILRDLIRDYGEARIVAAIAEDYKNDLVAETAVRASTGVIRGTGW